MRAAQASAVESSEPASSANSYTAAAVVEGRLPTPVWPRQDASIATVTRIESQSVRLARLGFADAVRAAELVEVWTAIGTSEQVDAVLAAMAAVPDPDLALTGFHRTVRNSAAVLAAVGADADLLRRVAAVMGSSAALNQHLVAHPDDIELLRGELVRRSAAQWRAQLLQTVGADPSAALPVAEPARSDDLRRGYHRAVLQIAARDLTSEDLLAILPEISAELADLADGTVETALALARGEVPDWALCRLGIVALGKTGAGELNYVSDVDATFYVAEPSLNAEGEPVCDSATAMAVATRLASALTRVCSAHTAAGTIWQIDAALRPEGKAGPLARTLASHRAYYEKWAKNWEFQAMLKARPMAGDLALAQSFVDIVWPMVWRVADNDEFVGEVQAMRKRVVSLLPSREANHEIAGGRPARCRVQRPVAAAGPRAGGRATATAGNLRGACCARRARLCRTCGRSRPRHRLSPAAATRC